MSLSAAGSTGAPPSRTTLSSSKQRITCIMASHSRIFPRNLLPNPSPFDAPFTRPAMSTISQVAGTIRPGCTISASFVRRSSGTLITPKLGSIVQKGKLAACALALERQLKSVDLPTLGKPTIPHFNDISSKVLFAGRPVTYKTFYIIDCKVSKLFIIGQVKTAFIVNLMLPFVLYPEA